jgi:SAM-dependent methyltransferase
MTVACNIPAERERVAIMRQIGIEEGRHAFGANAENYAAARPEYPSSIYARLRARCGLRTGTRTFEIGPGTGLATRRLLQSGASPLAAIEPDARLAQYLRQQLPDPALQVIHATFETASLPEAAFDLGVSATAFHWMDQHAALAKVATLLKPGGWWAAWWNVFGDPEQDDAFHDATRHLLEGGTTPSYSPAFKHPFALDRGARIADIESTKAFENIDTETERWTLTLDPKETRALYASFSTFAVLDEAERNRVLDAIENIAAIEFGGRVTRNICTPIYIARRR